jgi:hypothetical protein
LLGAPFEAFLTLRIDHSKVAQEASPTERDFPSIAVAGPRLYRQSARLV